MKVLFWMMKVYHSNFAISKSIYGVNFYYINVFK